MRNLCWQTSLFGSAIHGTRRWTLQVYDEALVVSKKDKRFEIKATDIVGFNTIHGLLWGDLLIESYSRPSLLLQGFKKSDLRAMGLEVPSVIAVAKKRSINDARRLLRDWFEDFSRLLNKRAWISDEAVSELVSKRPSARCLDFLAGRKDSPEVRQIWSKLSSAERVAIKYYNDDITELVKTRNEAFLSRELIDAHQFFSKIEKSPLTREQAISTIKFHNRMQVIASAGSGKTSVMVAKAAYAVFREISRPSEVLLLAFNRDAADELQSRIERRFDKAGICGSGVKAQTFHAFGLKVIGEATKAKPSIASWVEQNRDIEKLHEIVDGLKSADPYFRSVWEEFLLVFFQDVGRFGQTPAPTYYDRETRKRGFLTRNGETVKSIEERIIADWLFLNGVEYEYERKYEIETATADRSQYKPDFYYPSIGVYHEHFALDENGNPPEDFEHYLEGVLWKREVHRANGTSLIETTSASVRNGQAFKHLKRELLRYGVALDPDPDRPAKGRSSVPDEQILTTIRVFLIHVKNNCLTEEDLIYRIHQDLPRAFPYREKMFLDLFVPIWKGWQNALQQDNLIDFEDMLNSASELIEQGQWTSPYKVILVDEFQDASWARVRLIKALTAGRHRFLFAVGDDWQSINRFAGADPSVMLNFSKTFDAEVQLKLERTFRCYQEICDIASRFVQKNPNQIQKNVISRRSAGACPVHVIEVETDEHIAGIVLQRIEKIAKSIESNHDSNASRQKSSVLVLGRYRNDRQFMPAYIPEKVKQKCEIAFSTVHSSKGLEADYIILLRVVSGSYGFPSEIEDDPLLSIAMPQGDWYENAEERRLFYVALTRAKEEVTIVSLAGQRSSFVNEIVQDFKVKVFSADGEKSRVRVCPGCKKGVMVPRNGPSGQFLGCSRFPKCGFTSKRLEA